MEFKKINDFYVLQDNDKFSYDFFSDAIKKNRGKPIGLGRGSAFEFTYDDLFIVLREYRRGGFTGFFLKNIFFSDKRFSDEYNILKFLIKKNFPTAQPAFALYKKKWFLFNGFLGTHKILNADNFYDVILNSQIIIKKNFFELCSETIEKIFLLYELGVYNPDIHIKNILIERHSEKIFLIDFDKSRRIEKKIFYFYAMSFRFLRSIVKMNKKKYFFSTKNIFDLIEKIKNYSADSDYPAFISARILFFRQ